MREFALALPWSALLLGAEEKGKLLTNAVETAGRGPTRVVEVWSGVLATTMVTLAACIAVLVTPSPAAAAGACTHTRPTNYHNGFFYDPARFPGHNYRGASSYIVVRDAALCSGADGLRINFSNAYVMIAGGGGSQAWGQVGFIRTSGSPMRWFSQYTRPGGGLETWYSPYSINSTIGVRHAFRTYWASPCNCLISYIDSTQVSSSSFNLVGNWPEPWSPQYAGEVGILESNMPGTASARTAFRSMGVYTNTGSNIPVPCILTAGTDSSAWARVSHSCTAFDIYTR